MELAVLVIDLNAPGSKQFYDWAVAGLKPTLHGLVPGILPPGAFAGRNGFGQSRYSICPPKDSVHSYAVILYALPHHVALGRGFDPNALYKQGPRLPQGQSGFAYERR
jgi:phosphatidylethanolamine-binding protein (PEBP) family uncharacterized protein